LNVNLILVFSKEITSEYLKLLYTLFEIFTTFFISYFENVEIVFLLKYAHTFLDIINLMLCSCSYYYRLSAE